LIIFIFGSLVAALADSLLWLCVGRAIQGAGAVSSAVIALNADLTRDEVRTKSMAVIGVTIGLTFILSIILGPVLESIVGLPGIFLITALLTLVAIGIVCFYVPDPTSADEKVDVAPVKLTMILSNRDLLRLDFGIFSLHGILMAMFVSIPFILNGMGNDVVSWKFYLLVMLSSILIMLPLMMVSERFGYRKSVFVLSVALIALSQLSLGLLNLGYVGLAAALILFFGAFNMLEASLPSWVSRIAEPNSKGTALGVYSTSQYLGTFIGGVAGGWIYQLYTVQGVFVACAVWATIWLLVSMNISDTKRSSST
jgi:predicted MFS family arabinose efflux permease